MFHQKEAGLEIITDKTTYQAEQVISTLPPKLLINTIDFSPKLPDEILKLCTNTHTWMGESIKFAVEYKSPFWREKGFSGNIFSQVGIAQEVHDHTDFQENTFALKGFLSNGSRQLSQEAREKAVIQQFERFFGKIALDYLGYYERVWAKEEFTLNQSQTHLLPHQNNGNPIFQKSLFDDKFILAGTETSPVFGGYMEGAIYSAYLIMKKLLEKVG